MPAKIILNPYAARWNAGKQRPNIEAALEQHGIEYQLVASKEPWQAAQLAREAVSAGFDPIIAAGGDGTINEVLNGILQASGTHDLPRFGVIPIGTANDAANNLELPLEIEAAVGVIAQGQTRSLDLCQVNDRYFINNAGIGLEPYVTTIQETISYIQGTARYLWATLRAISHNPQWRMRLEWDDGEYEGPVTLVSIGNSPLTGGIFYTVPHANPYDGKLTFVYGHIPSRLGILRVLPKTMRPDEGSYVEHPAVHEHDCTWLKVAVEPSSPAHADGELFERRATKLHYRIHPGRVPLLIGT